MFSRWLLTAAFLVAACLAAGAQQKEIKHAAAPRTSASSGQEMFVSYCAVCHGKDGKGGGPAASALKTPPADLSALAAKNGGKFPAARVSTVLRGGSEAPVHGSKEMPVWGPVFSAVSQGQAAQVDLRIANLTKYVESLQVK